MTKQELIEIVKDLEDRIEIASQIIYSDNKACPVEHFDGFCPFGNYVENGCPKDDYSSDCWRELLLVAKISFEEN